MGAIRHYNPRLDFLRRGLPLPLIAFVSVTAAVYDYGEVLVKAKGSLCLAEKVAPIARDPTGVFPWSAVTSQDTALLVVISTPLATANPPIPCSAGPTKLMLL